MQKIILHDLPYEAQTSVILERLTRSDNRKTFWYAEDRYGRRLEHGICHSESGLKASLAHQLCDYRIEIRPMQHDSFDWYWNAFSIAHLKILTLIARGDIVLKHTTF